jgi:site-specific recombinase XerD
MVYAEGLFLARMTRKSFLGQMRQVDNGDNSARMHEVVNQTIGQIRENAKFLSGQRTELEKFYKTLRKDMGHEEIEAQKLPETEEDLQVTITKKDVRQFLEEKSDRGNAGSGLNVYLMAIKFYFEEVLGRKMWVDISYSKVPKRIQRCLTKEEVELLLKSIKNPKHRLMIALLYSSGMRVSELINLKIKDYKIEENS